MTRIASRSQPASLSRPAFACALLFVAITMYDGAFAQTLAFETYGPARAAFHAEAWQACMKRPPPDAAEKNPTQLGSHCLCYAGRLASAIRSNEIEAARAAGLSDDWPGGTASAVHAHCFAVIAPKDDDIAYILYRRAIDAGFRVLHTCLRTHRPDRTDYMAAFTRDKFCRCRFTEAFNSFGHFPAYAYAAPCVDGLDRISAPGDGQAR